MKTLKFLAQGSPFLVMAQCLRNWNKVCENVNV